MYDTPHLLKSVRNNLKKYDFKHQDGIYSWTNIVAVYNHDKDKVPRLAQSSQKYILSYHHFHQCVYVWQHRLLVTL